MNNYDVGYKKPPKHSQFRKGICPNPSGRGTRAPPKREEAIRNALNSQMEFRENGRLKRAPRLEVEIRKVVAQALKGNVESAAKLLRMHAHAKKYGDSGPVVITIKGGLPEHSK